MALSHRERARYARHLLLPEIGESGQERLLSTRVHCAGDAGARDVARAYLQRAGVCEAEADPDALRVDLPEAHALARLAGSPELTHAAAALAGAVAAVEAIRSALGAPAQRSVLDDFSLAAEDA